MAQCLEQIPEHQLVGGRVRQIIDCELDQDPGLADRICDSLGSNKRVSEVVPDATIQRLRVEVRDLLQANGHPPPVLPSPNVSQHTKLQGQLLHSWAAWAADPALPAASWLWLEAPAGISRDFKLDGLLEAVGPEDALSVDQLSVDCESFRNYAGVESDPEALAIINGHVSKRQIQGI